MTIPHIAAWKVTAFIWTAAIAIFAVDPTLRVAFIAGGAVLLTPVVNRLLDRWLPSKQLQNIQQAQNRMEISVDGNFKRMLDDKEKADALLTQSDKSLAHSEGKAEGVQHEQERTKDKS